MKAVGECRFCLSEQQLIKAHGIPRWVFRTIDNVGDSNLVVASKGKRLKKSRIGPYDFRILCANCDGYFGRLDGYAKAALSDNNISTYKGMSGVLVLKGRNPGMLKQFFASVLWRCSIADVEEFSKVQLGPFEVDLRDRLRNNPKSIEDASVYPMMLAKYERDQNSFIDLTVRMPERIRIKNINHYVIYFPHGYKVVVKVDQRGYSNIFMGLLGTTTEPLVRNLGNYEDSNDYRSLLESVD